MWTDVRTDVRTYGRTDGRTDTDPFKSYKVIGDDLKMWTDVRTYGRTDGRTDGQTPTPLKDDLKMKY